jgi:hypothetical protein
VPPAVGEKKRDVCFGGVPVFLSDANGFDGLEVPVGAAARRSSDRVEFPPTTLYMPFFLPGVAIIALWSARFCAMAARWTERCSDHATMPRQINTAAKNAPNAAPTHMKTVPSGRFDFCMNGAFEVSGTTISGVPTPANVGRSEGCETVESAVLLALDASVLEGASVVDGSAVVVAAPSGCVIEDSSGRPVSWASVAVVTGAAVVPSIACARTAGATSRRRPTRPAEGRMTKR